MISNAITCDNLVAEIKREMLLFDGISNVSDDLRELSLSELIRALQWFHGIVTVDA